MMHEDASNHVIINGAFMEAFANESKESNLKASKTLS